MGCTMNDARYIITGRIFDKDKLVGYCVLDTFNNIEHTVNKKMVIDMVNNGHIKDVKVTRNGENVSISGINGFELKKLKSIKYSDLTEHKKDNTRKQITEDIIIATLNRNCIQCKSNKLYAMEESDIRQVGIGLCQKYLNDTQIKDWNRLSNKVELTAVYYRTKYELFLGAYGYRVKNNSDENISYTRISNTNESYQSCIKPNSTKILSKGDMISLLSNPEISNTFKNGKVHYSKFLGFKSAKTLFELLSKPYIEITEDSVEILGLDELKAIISDDEYSKFFINRKVDIEEPNEQDMIATLIRLIFGHKSIQDITNRSTPDEKIIKQEFIGDLVRGVVDYKSKNEISNNIVISNILVDTDIANGNYGCDIGYTITNNSNKDITYKVYHSNRYKRIQGDKYRITDDIIKSGETKHVSKISLIQILSDVNINCKFSNGYVTTKEYEHKGVYLELSFKDDNINYCNKLIVKLDKCKKVDIISVVDKDTFDDIFNFYPFVLGSSSRKSINNIIDIFKR